MRRQELDLSQYSMMRGTAKNGSFYATFRQAGKPTLTSFGATAEHLVRASVADEKVMVALAGNLRTTARIDSVRCPVTGLDIRENGRVAAVPVVAQEILPALADATESVEPTGFWGRLRESARQFLGIEDEPKAPAPTVEFIKARSGYPVVDELVDRIGVELEKRPELADENGSRFDALAERYLFEMAANHAEAVKGASREHVERADRMFAEYVGIADQSLAESVKREEDREMGGKMDRLSIDLKFIRARQGVDMDGSLTAIPDTREPTAALPAPERTETLRSGRDMTRRILSTGKGPDSHSDGAEVVILHARDRSAASR